MSKDFKNKMATSLTSDAFYDFPCTLCAEDDVNKDSVVFCVNCQEYYCESHLKNHNRFVRDHQLIKREHLKGATPVTNPKGKSNLPEEKCSRHHGKLLDMYCQDHDIVACNVCVSLEHRNCSKLFYVPDIAKDQVTDKLIRETEQNLKQQTDVVTELKQSRQKHRTRIAKEKEICIDQVDERRKAIDRYLDAQQKQLKTSINEKYAEFDGKLEDDVNACDASIKDLNEITQKLGDTSRTNVSQIFVTLKRAEKQILNCEEKRQQCDENRNNKLGLQFNVGNNILDILKTEELLGKLNGGHKSPIGVEFVEDINIKSNTDKSDCECYDLCQLKDGTIVFTDSNNKNIKTLTLDNTYTLCDSLSMSNKPWGVCCVNNDEVAVTVPGDYKVEFVKVKPTLSRGRSFKVDCQCHAIGYYNDKLYIGHNQNAKLSVYDLQGHCLQTFSTNKNGDVIFGASCHLHISAEKQQIFVADSKKGVIVVDMKGQQVAEYSYPNRAWTIGVCQDGHGNVFVADNGMASKEIIGLSLDNASSVVLYKSDKKPLSVNIDQMNGRLLATFNKTNFIKVFSVKYGFQ